MRVLDLAVKQAR